MTQRTLKLDQLHKLKEKLLAHDPKYPKKEFSKQLEYDSLKDNILKRIQLIEDIAIKKERYIRDIDKHLARMEKKLKITFVLEAKKVGDLPPPAPVEEKKVGSDTGLIP